MQSCKKVHVKVPNLEKSCFWLWRVLPKNSSIHRISPHSPSLWHYHTILLGLELPWFPHAKKLHQCEEDRYAWTGLLTGLPSPSKLASKISFILYRTWRQNPLWTCFPKAWYNGSFHQLESVWKHWHFATLYMSQCGTYGSVYDIHLY